MKPRDLTRIRLQAARAVRGHRLAIDGLEEIMKIVATDDARELRKKPSLRKGYKPKRGKRS